MTTTTLKLSEEEVDILQEVIFRYCSGFTALDAKNNPDVMKKVRIAEKIGKAIGMEVDGDD